MTDLLRIFEFRGLVRKNYSKTSDSITSDPVPDNPRVYWLINHITGRTAAAAGPCILGISSPDAEDNLLYYDGNTVAINLNRPVLMEKKEYITFTRWLTSDAMLLSIRGFNLWLKDEAEAPRKGFWRFIPRWTL